MLDIIQRRHASLCWRLCSSSWLSDDKPNFVHLVSPIALQSYHIVYREAEIAGSMH